MPEAQLEIWSDFPSPLPQSSRLMIGDAIGEPLALTVLRSEALVDVTVSPEELKADE